MEPIYFDDYLSNGPVDLTSEDEPVAVDSTSDLSVAVDSTSNEAVAVDSTSDEHAHLTPKDS